MSQTAINSRFVHVTAVMMPQVRYHTHHGISVSGAKDETMPKPIFRNKKEFVKQYRELCLSMFGKRLEESTQRE